MVEARRRRVWTSAAAYAAAAFVIAQVADIVLPALGLPESAMRVTLFVLVAGLPAVVLTSWLFDVLIVADPKREERLTTPEVSGDNAALFIGRSEELATLDSLAALESTRLISIVGPGGIGKSRLAMAWAEAVRDSLPDGVAVAFLDGLRSRGALLTEVARALGIVLQESRRPERQIPNELDRRACLLILDGAEGLVDQGPLVTQWAHAAAQSRVLVTSRVPLLVKGEHVLTLSGLNPSTEPPGSAVELFVALGRQQAPDFDPQGDELASVGRFCELVDGLPFAIELGAALMASLRPSDLVAIVASGRDLESDRQDVPERQRSVGVVLDWSWRSLSSRERDVMDGLAAFEGRFPRAWAETLSGASPPELNRLVRLGLIHVSGDGSLTVNRTLRAHVRRQRTDWPGPELGRQHAELVMAELQRAAAELGSLTHESASAALAALHADVLRSWGHLIAAADYDALLSMADPVRRYLEVSGRYEEGRDWALTAISEFSSDQPKAKVLMGHLEAVGGLFALRLGDFTQSARLLHSAIETLAGAESPVHLAFALNSMGDVLALSGRYDEAQLFCEKAHAIFRAETDPAGVAASSNNLGVVAQRRGDLEEAGRRYLECLDACKERDDLYGASMALNNLGVVHHDKGDLTRAAGFYQRALDLSNRIGDRDGEASALTNIARVSHSAGDFEQAEEQARRAHHLFSVVGNVLGGCVADLTIGDALLGRGRLGESQARFRDALSTAYSKGVQPLVGESLLGIAAVYVNRGDLESAVPLVASTMGCHQLDEDAKARRTTLQTRLRDAGFDTQLSHRLLDVARDTLQHHSETSEWRKY